MPERLQKIIARAGIASRRKAEGLITAGRVTVNGIVVRQLGSCADATTDQVLVDGTPVPRGEGRRYLVMNKPKGCITSTNDPEGRTTVMDLLGPHAARGLFPVGRLDYNTEGLLILTNDGDFANQVLAAKNKVPKTYEVKVSGRPSDEAIQKLRGGIKIDGHLIRPESIRLIKTAANPWYEVTLVAGRNRQIHRMFERIGSLVEKMRRVRIGSLTLKGLEPRQVRELQPAEVQHLLENRPFRQAARPAPLRPRDRNRGGRGTGPKGRVSQKPRRHGGRGDRDSRQGPAHSSPDAQRRSRYAGRSESEPRQERARPGRSKGPKFKQSAKPQRSRGRPQSTSGRSPARAAPSGRGGFPRRSSTRSRAPRSSRPGSRAKP